MSPCTRACSLTHAQQVQEGPTQDSAEGENCLLATPYSGWVGGCGGWLFQESSLQEMLGCRLSRKVISLGPLWLRPLSKWPRRLWDTWRPAPRSQSWFLRPRATGWVAPALHVERGLQGNISASPPQEKQSSGQRALSEIFAMKITIFLAAPGTAQGSGEDPGQLAEVTVLQWAQGSSQGHRGCLAGSHPLQWANIQTSQSLSHSPPNLHLGVQAQTQCPCKREDCTGLPRTPRQHLAGSLPQPGACPH